MGDIWQVRTTASEDPVEYDGTISSDGGALRVDTTSGETVIWGPGAWTWAKTVPDEPA